MNKESINLKSGDPDGTKAPFEEKASSKLIWILPSILVHIIVVALWLAMPEDPRVIEERELVINSEQAEQLKDFVEDANLQELRMELRRLQEIKSSMNSIRSNELTHLAVFEREMQESVNADGGLALRKILNNQSNILKHQQLAASSIDELEKLFNEMQPLIQKQDFVQLAPLTGKAMSVRTAIKEHQEKIAENQKLLRADIDTADSILSWLKSSDIVNKWEELVVLQEKTAELQGLCSDEQGQIYYIQQPYLKKISEQGGELPASLKAVEDQARKEMDDYLATKKKYTDELKKAELDEKKILEKQKQLDELLNKIKVTRNEVKKRYTKHPKKTEEEKAKRQVLQDESEELDKQYKKVIEDKKLAQNERNRLHKVYNDARLRLSRLKPPKQTKTPQEIQNEMRNTLQSLNKKAGDIRKQQDAFKVQKKAVELCKELAKDVQLYMGGGK